MTTNFFHFFPAAHCAVRLTTGCTARGLTACRLRTHVILIEYLNAPSTFMHGGQSCKFQTATYQCTKHPLRTRRAAYQNRLKCTMCRKPLARAGRKYTQGTPPHPSRPKNEAHGMTLKYTPAQPTATAGKTR